MYDLSIVAELLGNDLPEWHAELFEAAFHTVDHWRRSADDIEPARVPLETEIFLQNGLVQMTHSAEPISRRLGQDIVNFDVQDIFHLVELALIHDLLNETVQMAG